MWIKFDDAVKILGCSQRTIFRRVKEGAYNSCNGSRQGNGRTETLIELESLPASAQVRYWRSELAQGKAVDSGFGMDGLTELSESEMEVAWHRAQVVMEMAQPAAGVKRCDHLAALAGREGISLSKLYKWEKVFKAQGLAGLVKRRGRSDCGIKRVFDQEAVKYLKAQYTGRRSKLKAYEDLAGVAVDMGWKIGSYAQACRILTSEIDRNEALRTYMVGGALALKNSAAPCILRDYSDLQPLEYVCGDHMQADVLVWDEAEKRIMRPWLTAWEDLRTRCVWGWHVNRQPNSRTIALALRHGILPKSDQNPIYGIPQNVYIDNGKDYR
ncbi:MAG TPA: helix-turn-helix domain-containing protein, partial [bacterium]|nr:helix-turn-helix domain-containing protein [bacterium]HPN44176.1 helix-turn-helix domain-containing protein [bacterium]